jgi:hypothetical protein
MLTYISATQINNYAAVEDLQRMIIETLTRWMFHRSSTQGYWFQVEATGVYILEVDQLHFELALIGENLYQLSMFAHGHFRRNGTSCDYFERAFDCLAVQIERPHLEFAKMSDCLTLAYPPSDIFEFNNPVAHGASLLPAAGVLADMVVYDEDDEDEASDDDAEEDDADEEDDASEEDEEDEEAIVALRDMTDAQIDEYINDLGMDPCDEIQDWTMNYQGGPILRYSYVNFLGICLADQTVSNCVIRGTIFAGSKIQNCVFDHVDFYSCDFTNVVFENVTFINSLLVECYISQHAIESCRVENTPIDAVDEDESPW